MKKIYEIPLAPKDAEALEHLAKQHNIGGQTFGAHLLSTAIKEFKGGKQ